MDGIHADNLYFHHLLHPQTTRDSPEKDHNAAAGSGDSKRRSRGRPYGLKNKPKPPIIVSRDSPNSLGSHVLEVSPGEDIVGSVSVYARRRGRGICVLSGSGEVSDVTLRPPEGSGNGSLVALQGQFEILSLSGTVLPPPAPPGSSSLSLLLSGRGGQVVGGSVVGKLVASGPVILMAASFANAVFERLPLDAKEEEEEAVRGQQMSTYQSLMVASGGGGSGGDGGGGGFPLNQVVGQYYNTGSDFHAWSENVMRPPF